MRVSGNTITGIALLTGILTVGCAGHQKSAENNPIEHSAEKSISAGSPENDKFLEYKRNGILKTESGDFAGAIKDLDKAVQLNSKNVSVFFYRGYAKFKTNDQQGAIGDFTRAIELDPNGIYYKSRGIAKDASNDYTGALRDLDTAIIKVPLDAEFYFYRGITKRHLNDTKGACIDWQTAADGGYDEAGELLEEYCR